MADKMPKTAGFGGKAPRDVLPRAGAFSDGTLPELFPKLDDRHRRAIARFAVCREFARGEVLFAQGVRDAPFYLVDEGGVDFVDRAATGPRYIATLGAGGFIGDVSMFTGEPTVAECVAAERTRVQVMDAVALRRLVAEEGDLGEIILRTFLARRAWLEGNGYGAQTLIGGRSDPHTARLRHFLGRNQIPYEWLDPETDPAARRLAESFGLGDGDLPAIAAGDRVCRRPDVGDVAEAVGLRPALKGDGPYDLVVIGAGPAGLAATVYGASEGLDTLCLDADSPGGQAGTSSKIENYLGFATGIGGGELARQAVLQARKFGATLTNPRGAARIECGGDVKTVRLDDGTAVTARAVVIATGARYRKLDAAVGCEGYEGRGVYYAAGQPEAVACGESPVVVVGAGNSAGQAAVFLSRRAERVTLVVRGPDLGRSMSKYLLDRIEHAENVDVRLGAEVAKVEGDGRLERVTLADGTAIGSIAAGGLFVMIGAVPNTGWLAGSDCVGLDAKGFVVTGNAAAEHGGFARHWTEPGRGPFLLETTRPGILAAGDVRGGSVKRVASGVGEGAMSVKVVHEVLELARARETKRA